jgi:hypothetical protein
MGIWGGGVYTSFPLYSPIIAHATGTQLNEQAAMHGFRAARLMGAQSICAGMGYYPTSSDFAWRGGPIWCPLEALPPQLPGRFCMAWRGRGFPYGLILDNPPVKRPDTKKAPEGA